MYSATALFSISTSLVCVAFSALFFIIYLSIDRQSQFLGYCLVTLALAIHQAAVGLRILFENNNEQFLFWIKVAYIVAVLIGGALTAISNMLTGRTGRSRFLILLTVTVVLVVLLVFTPLFGAVSKTMQDGGYEFSPGLMVYIVGLFLVVLFFIVVARLLLPFFLGDRNPRAKTYVIVAVAAGMLMVGLILDIAMDFNIIASPGFAFSSPGAFVWVIVGALGILYQYYRLVAPEKQALVHLREPREDAAETMAISDGLTNLFSRDFFDENIEAEVLDSIQNNRSLSLMMIRLDDFKQATEVLGKGLTDSLVSEIAAVIKRGLKGSDLPARYDNEIFAILLPNTGIPGAEEVAERIRHMVEEMEFLSPGNPDVTMTVSVGVTTLRGSDMPADFVDRCMDTLKAAIKHGGNRVNVTT